MTSDEIIRRRFGDRVHLVSTTKVGTWDGRDFVSIWFEDGSYIVLDAVTGQPVERDNQPDLSDFLRMGFITESQYREMERRAHSGVRLNA